MAYRDIKYSARAGVATITINRPKVHNAFRARTCDELIEAFHKAAWNDDIGVIVLTGAEDGDFSIPPHPDGPWTPPAGMYDPAAGAQAAPAPAPADPAAADVRTRDGARTRERETR